MSRYYVPMTQGQPQNMMLDFSPINNGINAIGEAQQNATRNAMAREDQRMRRDQFAAQQARAVKQDARTDIDWYGKQAEAVSRMQGPQRAAAWQRIIAKHGADGLSQEEMDPMTGPQIMMAQAGQYIDPLERQTAEAKLGLIRAQTAQASQRAEPDPIKQFVAGKLRAMGPRVQIEQQAPQQQGQVLPQSYDGANGISGLQLAADAQDAPQAQAAPDLVDTPFGKMSRGEARDLGSTMLLDPRYATAGKAILDSVDGPNQGQMGKLAQNQLEEKTINSVSMLARLGDIEKRFDPKFLEIPKRLEMLGASWSAKLGPTLGGKISPDQQKELSRYVGLRSAAVNHLNSILKELSGAAVTPQEYERIKNDSPNAGTGIFDGDDPVSFKAKLDRSSQATRAAIARYNFMRSRGLNFDRNSLDQFLTLDDVPAAIDRRGAEIETELRKSGADAKTIDQQVRRKLKQEFGI